MRYDVRIEDRDVQLEVERTGSGWRVRQLTEDEGPGAWQNVDGRFAVDGDLLLQRTGRQVRAGVYVDGEDVHLQVDGHALQAQVQDPRKAAADLSGGVGEGVIQTPMPGVVVRIPASVGQEVKAGDVVVVVEAMKMENEFKAPVDGVVAAIHVDVGQALESKAVLATIE